MESKIFILNAETPVTSLGDGVARQMLGYNDRLMMVKVIFAKGAVGALHSHHHAQTSYCASGSFVFTVGDTSQVLNPGDGVYIPSDTMHGVVCLEDGVLIDSFNPARLDFLP
jgi:quercetin dioxygenase-like cupin family protein